MDITTSLDTDANIICGSTTSLSPFAMFEPKDPVELFDGLATLVAELNARKGIANSLDAKLDTILKALGDANQNNDGAAASAMDAFIHAAQAQSGEQIEPGEADELIGAGLEIIKVLTGQFL